MPALLLRVRDLTVGLRGQKERLLKAISFELSAGETLGILGRSGAGKSTLARALLGMLPQRRWQISGSIALNGVELVAATKRTLERVRGREITIVGQEPELALNPVLRIGRQIEEVLRAHFDLDRRRRRREAEAALAAVGLSEARFYDATPDELSGGQRQRAVIAQALAAKPALLIVDEPTSAVDTITQAEVLDLLRQLRSARGLALLFITHNPVLLDGFTNRALLVANGRAEEVNPFESGAPL